MSPTLTFLYPPLFSFTLLTLIPLTHTLQGEHTHTYAREHTHTPEGGLEVRGKSPAL